MKQKRTRWAVCKKQRKLDPKTAEPVEVAFVTENALANGAFSKYLKKMRRIAFDLRIHGASFDGRVDLSKLPTITVKGGEDDNG